MVIQKLEAQAFKTFFSHILVAHDCEARKVPLRTGEPHIIKGDWRCLAIDAHSCAADVFRYADLALDVLQGIGQKIYTDRPRLFAACSPAALDALPLLCLKTPPGFFFIPYRRMLACKFQSHHAHATAERFDSPDYRICLIVGLIGALTAQLIRQW